MAFKTQLEGVDRFLAVTYGKQNGLSGLFAELGFGPRQVEQLCHQHLELMVAFFVALLRERVVAYSDGDRLYQVVSRRFGLDGGNPEVLRSLGSRLGVSRERVRQLEQKAIKKCKAKAHWQSSASGLRAMAAALVGDAERYTESPLAGGGREALVGGLRATVEEQTSPPESKKDAQLNELATRVRSIIQLVPDGLTCNILAHILAGSTGPVIAPLVVERNLPHYGSLRSLGHPTIKQMIKEFIVSTCAAARDFEVIAGKLKLKTERLSGSVGERQDRSNEPRAEGRLARVRATYPRAYEPWTERDDVALALKHQQGVTIQELSVLFQRQPGGIRSRLAKLGLAPVAREGHWGP